MSNQTVALRQHLHRLDAQINDLKIARNECVIALTTTPSDKAAAKRLTELNASIPSIETEIAAYEDALEHATRRDKVAKQAAAALDRRESADRAVEVCKGIAALNAQITEIKTSLRDAEAKRDYEHQKCRSAALQVVRYAGCSIDIYTSLVGLVSDAVATGQPAYLRWRLDDLLSTAEEQDRILGDIA